MEVFVVFSGAVASSGAATLSDADVALSGAVVLEGAVLASTRYGMANFILRQKIFLL